MPRVRRAARRLATATRPIAPALFVGLALRYGLAPFTSWPHDDVVWFQAASSGQHQLGLFARSQFPYPPLWGLLLQALGQALGPLGITGSALGTSDAHFALLDQATNGYSAVITGPLFNVAFKTVLFAFDVGSGLLIREAVRSWTASSRKSNLAFAIWFLSPFPLFESAIFGGFDTMVGFCVMATLVLLLRRQYVWTGVAIGLGIFIKVSPIFLLPMAGLLAADVTVARRRLHMDVRAAAAVVLGVSIPVVIIGLPLLISGAASAATHATSARAVAELDVGGFSIFGVRSLAALSGVGTWSSDHAGLVTTATTLAALIGSVVIGWTAMVAARKDRAWAVLGGGTAVFAFVMLTQPLTQPQYLLWLLPAAITVAVAAGIGRWQLVILSVAPVVYVYSLLGPAAVLGPLATATGWVSPQWITDRSVEWYNAPAVLWGDSLGGDFRAPVALAGIVALASLLALVLRRMGRAAPQHSEPHEPAHRSTNIAVALVAAVLLATVGATVFAYRLPPLGRSQASLGTVTASPTAGGTRLQLTVHPGPGQSVVRVVAFPTAQYTQACSLDVVVDPAYPGPDSTPRAIQGVFDHLTAELRLRGDQRPITEIDVPDLVKVLTDVSEAAHTCVVMTAGVMPADVFSRRIDRLTPWLHAGGMLIWSGDAIGYYSEDPTTKFVPDTSTSFHDPGPSKVVGDGVIQLGKRPGSTADQATPVAQALGLTFNSTVVGVNQDALSSGERSIGYTGDGVSSVTDISVGPGSVLVFAGDTYNEEIIAHDLWLILLSHVLDGHEPIAYVDVPAATAARGPITWIAPMTAASGESIVVDVLDPALEGVTFLSQVVAP